MGVTSAEVMAEVYSILEDYETEGCDLYNYGALNAITNYFNKMHPRMRWISDVSEWPNEEGGTCAIAWSIGAIPHMVMFDFKYSRGV